MSNPSIGGVYAITNTRTRRRYIGSSSNPPERMAAHRRLLQTGAHDCPLLQEDWLQLGPDAFTFQLLSPASDPRELEQLLIVQHQRGNWPLYNRRAAKQVNVTTDADFLAAVEHL